MEPVLAAATVFGPKTPLDQGFGFITLSDGSDLFMHIKVGIAAHHEEMLLLAVIEMITTDSLLAVLLPLLLCL